MVRRPSSLQSRAAAAALVGIVAATAAQARDEPRLEEKILYTNQVRYRVTRSMDRKALSVVFDNFSVALVKDGGAGPAIRILPLKLPVVDAGKGVTLRVQARGGLNCPSGVECVAILWVSGRTKVFTPPAGKKSSDLVVETELQLPPANSYQAAIILIVDRETRRQGLAASIGVKSMEFSIARGK